jgi:hypothetical protein
MIGVALIFADVAGMNLGFKLRQAALSAPSP